jgi:hypothetical protein
VRTVFSRRFFAGIVIRRRPASRAVPPAIGKSGPLPKAATVCGPTVVTVTSVLPLPVMEGGLTEQVASLIVGGTVQLKAIVPVNPPVGLTVIDEVPDCPGAEMLTLAGFTDKVKPGMTVTTSGVEAEAS